MLEICSVASGSDGNCICVGTDRTHVLIDVGLSGKRVEAGLNEFGYTSSDIEGILVTHEHADHVAGLGVMARKLGVPLYATSATIQAIYDKEAYYTSLGKKWIGPIDRSLFHEITPEVDFMIGDMTFHPIHVSHDAADPVAYRFTNGREHMAVMTDLGTYDANIIENLQGLHGLLLESNHDVRMLQTGPYPYPLKQRILGDYGHLSNERSGQLLCELLHDNLDNIMLGHLSGENNYPDLAYETVRMEVTMGDNPYKAEDFRISVARRGQTSPRIQVG